eukprot:4105849-Amphidinium_carterae.1
MPLFTVYDLQAFFVTLFEEGNHAADEKVLNPDYDHHDFAAHVLFDDAALPTMFSPVARCSSQLLLLRSMPILMWQLSCLALHSSIACFRFGLALARLSADCC